MVSVVWEVMGVLAVLFAIAGLLYVLGLTGTVADDDNGPSWSGLAVVLVVAVFLLAMILPLVT
jgi:membrane protein YdbS with pleckstrin-like domain